MAGKGNVRVKFSADTSDLRAGTAMARREIAGMSGSLSKFSKGAAAAGAAGAGVAGGMLAIAQAQKAVTVTKDLGLATAKLHKTLGLSNKEASAFVAQAKVRGIESKALQQSFLSLAKNVTKGGDAIREYRGKLASLGTSEKDQAARQKLLETGAGKQVEALKRLGLSQEQIRKGNFSDVLKTAAQTLSEMKGGTEKAALSAKLFGKGWQTVAPMLAGGRKGIDELVSSAAKMGVTLDDSGVKKAKEFAKAQRENKLAMMGLQVTIGQLLLPALTKLATFTTKAVTSLRKHWPEIKREIEPVVEIVKYLGGVVFADFHRRAKASLQAVRGALQIVSGILHGDFSKAWKGVKNLVAGAAKGMLLAVAGITKPLRDALRKPFEGLKTFVSGVFNSAASAVGKFVATVLRIVDLIPGTNLGKLVASAERWGKPQARARGGHVTRPTFLVGEEAPAHPEWVIATNPAYRSANVRYWAQAGHDLGVPGFARGGGAGVGGYSEGKRSMRRTWWHTGGLDPIAAWGQSVRHKYWWRAVHNARRIERGGGRAEGGPVPGYLFGGLVDTVLRATPLAPVVAAGDVASWGLEQFVGKLPGNQLRGVFSGLGEYILKAAKGAIGDLLAGSEGSGETAVGGLVPQVQRALAFARRHGWKGNVYSGYRTAQEQAAAAAGFIARGGSYGPGGPQGSLHRLGQAVDLTDPEGFARAMAMAPPGSRLYNRVPGDRPHWSVTGYKTGGKVSGRVSVFGPPAEKASSMPYKDAVPGIAIRSMKNLRRGNPYLVGIDGRWAILPQTDWGPNARTGRAIDVTGKGAITMGFAVGPGGRGFPTDARGSATELLGVPRTAKQVTATIASRLLRGESLSDATKTGDSRKAAVKKRKRVTHTPLTQLGRFYDLAWTKAFREKNWPMLRMIARAALMWVEKYEKSARTLDSMTDAAGERDKWEQRYVEALDELELPADEVDWTARAAELAGSTGIRDKDYEAHLEEGWQSAQLTQTGSDDAAAIAEAEAYYGPRSSWTTAPDWTPTGQAQAGATAIAGAKATDTESVAAQSATALATAQNAQRLAEGFTSTIRGLGDVGSGQPIVIVNTLHPGDPATLRAIGDAAVGGFALQGFRSSPREGSTL